MAHEWKDKVVLITGAATAIGAAVVEILMKENVKHVAVLDINEAAGLDLQNKLNSANGDKVKFYKCDVTNEGRLIEIFNAVLTEQGYIDVVINNAGIMNDGLHVYKKMIDVNVTALTTGTLKAIEMMSKESGGRGGTVINISSIAALFQDAMLPIYYATKSFVLQFSNCIGTEEYYSRNGVRVVAICYGATDTPLLSKECMGNFDKKIEDQIQEMLSKHPYQKKESAALGLVEAYKKAKSGSTWLSIADLPVKEITDDVTKGYEVFSAPFSA